MSASDKKKQRKAAQAEGLTQKQMQEQAQAATAKRNRAIYTAVGVVCAIAAVALLIWNNMSSWQAKGHQNATAATIGGEKYTVADLQYYYSNIRNYFVNYAGYDINADDGAQWFNEADNQTYADYFRDTALDNLKQTAALCAAAKAEGYTLSPEGQKDLDESMDQVDIICVRYNLDRATYFSQQYGVSEAVYLRNRTQDVLANEYATAHQEGISYDDAALKEYYDEHPDDLDSYDFRSFFISGAAADPVDADGNPVKDADGNTVTATDEEKAAAMAEAKEKADQAVAEISAASDKDAAFVEAAPKYVAENQKEAYAEEGYSLNTGVVGNTLTSSRSVMASWLMDSARKAGDVTALESSGSGYYVVLFKNRALVTDPTVDVRHILIRAEMDEGAQEPTQEQMDAAKAEAQSLLDQWNARPQEEKTPENFGALAEEHSDDTGSNTNGGEYTYVYEGQMVKNFNDWCFDSARKDGDVGLVENAGPGYWGYHVIYFEHTNAPYWEHLATQAKQETEQNEWLTALTDATEVVNGDGMQYVGDPNTAVPTTPAPDASAEPTASPAA